MRRLLALSLLLLLAACTGKPGDELILHQVRSELLAETDGRLFTVEGLAKVNGLPRGEHTYIAEMEYDLRFKMGLQQALGELQKSSGSIFAAGMEAVNLRLRYGDFDAGDVIHRQARATFYWTEKGWRLEELAPSAE